VTAAVRGEALRRRLLRLHADTGLGHVGGNLSCLDLLEVLYHDVLGPDDVFVLSKGHAAGALYTVLWSRGLISEEQLSTWCADGTDLPGHPVPSVPGVFFSTGSLGHGLSLALGLAIGQEHRKADGRVVCLTSDGEWQEGSTWEALMMAMHRQPTNLTVIIDINGWQGFGTTQEVASMGDLAERLIGFGAPVVEVDGHDPSTLKEVLRASSNDGFRVVCARTVKGRGTSLAGSLESHYLPLPGVDHPDAL
jgi:transketolase